MGTKNKKRLISLLLMISMIVSLFSYAIAVESPYDEAYTVEGGVETSQVTQGEPPYAETTASEYVTPPVEDTYQDSGAPADESASDDMHVSDEAYTDEYDDEGYIGIVPMSADLTPYVTVTGWDLVNAAGDSIFDIVAVYNTFFAFSFQFNLSLEGAQTIVAGDTFRFERPVPYPQGHFGFGNTSWQDFTDINNVTVGQWRINSHHIEVRFAAAAAGSSGLTGGFRTGYVIRNAVRLGGTHDITFANETRQATFQQHELLTSVSQQAKVAMAPTANTIRWQLNVNRGDVMLAGRFWSPTIPGAQGSGRPGGFRIGYQQFTNTNIFVEDTLYGTFDSAGFRTRISHPRSLAEDSNWGFAATTTALFLDIDEHMNRISPNSGESRAAFRARIISTEGAMTWGVWKDYAPCCGPLCGDFASHICLGTETFMAYFGTLGASAAAGGPARSEGGDLTMSSIYSGFAAAAAAESIYQGVLPESYRSALVDYYTALHGNANVVNGRIVNIVVDIVESFPYVTVATPRSNTMTVTRNGVDQSTTATGSQGPMEGGGDLTPSDRAEIRLVDQVSGLPLGGGVFQLQVQGAGNTWTDEPGRVYITNPAGIVVTGALSNGVFRFVQDIDSPPTANHSIPDSAGFNSTLGTVVSSQFTINTALPAGPTVTVQNIQRFNVTYTVTAGDGVPGTFTPAVPGQATHLHNADVTVASILTSEVPTRTVGGVTQTGRWEFQGWTPPSGLTVTGTGPDDNRTYTFTLSDRDVVSNIEFTGYWRFIPDASFTVSYVLYGPAPTNASTALPGSITRQVGAANVPREDGMTTSVDYRMIDGVRVTGTWTFDYWEDRHASPVMTPGVEGTFTMPGRNVVFTGTWSFEADPSFTVSYVLYGPAPTNASTALPGSITRQVGATNVPREDGMTTTVDYRMIDGVRVLGTWTFDNWEDRHASPVMTPGVEGTFTMPGRDVVFTGTWNFTASPTITKTANNATSAVDEYLTYIITVTNSNADPLTGPFVVVDELNINWVRFMPETFELSLNGTVLESAEFAFNELTGVLRVPIAILQPGDTVITFSVEILPAAAGQVVKNLAVLETPPELPPPPPPYVETPIITLTKIANTATSAVGDEITYTITATNPGEDPIPGEFVIVDNLDIRFVRFMPETLELNGTVMSEDDFSFDEDTGELRIPISPLPVGDTVVRFSVEILPAAAGQVVENLAVLEAPPEVPPPPPPYVETPIIRLTKTANTATSAVGDEITYTITVTNPGDDPIPGEFVIVDNIDIRFVRFIPETFALSLNGTALESAEFAFNEVTGVLRVTLATLQPGNTVVTFNVEILPAAAGQVVENLAVLEAPPEVPPPPPPYVETPIIRLTKTANTATSAVGDEITYTITVTNPGDDPIPGEFVIVDNLDISLVRFMPETLMLNGSPLSTDNYLFNASTGELRIPLNPLATGDTVVTFSVEVLPAAAGQVVENLAVLETPPDVPPPLPPPPVETPIPTLTKTANTTTSVVGENITYTITAINPGAAPIPGDFAIVDMIDIRFVRFMPETLTLNGSPLVADYFMFNATTGELRVPLNPLAAGNTVVTFSVEVLPAAYGQTVRNVAVLETPPSVPQPPETPPVEVPIAPEEIRNIRIYYYLQDENGNLTRDIQNNPYGRGYFYSFGSTFSTNHVLDRNNLNNGNEYEFEGWLVHVGGQPNDNYLTDKNRDVLHGSFIVPAPGVSAHAAAFTALTDGTTEVVGGVVSIIAVWSVVEDEDDKELPKTGVESNNTLLWTALLLLALLLAASTIVGIKEERSKKMKKSD